MEPTLPNVFYWPLAWSCPQVFKSGLGIRLCEGRCDKEFVFMHKFLEFQSYSRHKNHFDIDSKQTHSEKIQVIPMERLLEGMKTFCFAFWWKIRSDIWLVEMVQDLIGEFQRISLESIHFICMNNNLVHMRKHYLPIQIACLWSERAWLGT